MLTLALIVHVAAGLTTLALLWACFDSGSRQRTAPSGTSLHRARRDGGLTHPSK